MARRGVGDRDRGRLARSDAQVRLPGATLGGRGTSDFTPLPLSFFGVQTHDYRKHPIQRTPPLIAAFLGMEW